MAKKKKTTTFNPIALGKTAKERKQVESSVEFKELKKKTKDTQRDESISRQRSQGRKNIELPSIDLNKQKKEETNLKVQKAVEAPFKDPKGFVKESLSGESLAETLPLALGATGILDTGLGALGQKVTNKLSQIIPQKVAPAVFKGIQSQIGLAKYSGTAGNLVKGKFVTIPGKVISYAGKNANVVNTFASNAKSARLTKKILIGQDSLYEQPL